jgi:hypothetical protein
VRRPFLLVPLALALAAIAAPSALAGGFATVGLSSTPTDVKPGDPWNVQLTVLQHGRTPLEGVQPQIVIRSGDAQREFTAVPTGKSGVYRAEVVFPAAGTWTYEVRDGFNNDLPHTFPAVRIGAGSADATPASAPAPASQPPAPPAADDGGIAAGWLWAAGAALLLAAAVVGLDRRRRRPAAVGHGTAEPA